MRSLSRSLILVVGSQLTTSIGRYFLVASSSSVKIRSTTTGQLLSTLKSKPVVAGKRRDGPRLANTVTAMLINPSNPYQLYTGSSDGYIRLWDFIDAVLLETIDVKLPIVQLCASHTRGFLFVVGQRPRREPATGIVCSSN